MNGAINSKKLLKIGDNLETGNNISAALDIGVLTQKLREIIDQCSDCEEEQKPLNSKEIFEKMKEILKNLG